MYTLAIPDYLLKGGDDYSMFMGQRVLVTAEDGDLMLGVIEDYVKAHPNLAPATENRIRIAR
jgi:hypothetical protein